MNLRDRVQCATATTGTGTVTLGAATAGYRTFTSAFAATANNVSYMILDGDAWETGVGQYNKGGNSLSRTLDASSTGSLLSLSGSAVVSLVFLSREHVPDWPIATISSDAGSGETNSFQDVSSGGFTTLAIATVENDTHGAWDTATNNYVIPQTGTYDIDAKVRFKDGTASGRSYGVGIDVANQDSAGFQWANTLTFRQGGFNSRTMMLTTGQRIRLFIYCDGFTGQVNKAYLRIARVR